MKRKISNIVFLTFISASCIWGGAATQAQDSSEPFSPALSQRELDSREAIEITRAQGTVAGLDFLEEAMMSPTDSLRRLPREFSRLALTLLANNEKDLGVEAAREALSRMRRMDGGSDRQQSNLRYHEGYLLESLGDRKAAAVAYEASLENNPRNEGALAGMKRINAALKVERRHLETRERIRTLEEQERALGLRNG